ncbi:enhancer of polycomb homolog 1-like [Sinocyclocheilus grahami]|uniref:enhancer of polycomb homolog 1-like n=1 Tax=Sinocyclocheilus grahami TaxID=75366 RepID=UPI0007AC9FF0|nr:PREDICTED: enhancer of polycomb homolog 1-like [Sinocyclocheilus grahami]
MSKLSFRARALDALKPLPVFRCEDLPDLHEYASINRAVPQMPTGMEKDEESEHHLQRAISAQQVYGEKRDNMVIPVPEAESNITYYDSLYPGDFRMPKQLIHIQRECTGLIEGNRKNDEASYEKMLKLRRDLSRAVTVLEMIKKREKSKRELLHLTLEIVEKRNAMPDFGLEVMAEALAMAKPVYKIPIIPFSSSSQYLHQDHIDFKDYKAKPEKTEVVRTKRKYEKRPKILPLSAPLHTGPSVFNPKDLNQYDFPSSDDEPFSQIHSGSSEAEEENEPDGAFAFRRKAGCVYHAPRLDHSGDWPWSGETDGESCDPRFRYSLTTLTIPRRCVGLARRRVGRGGRLLLDRAYSNLNGLFQSLDSESEPDFSFPASPLHPETTSQTVTSSSSSSHTTYSDLRQILRNIKACRWRHFKPRTLTSQSGAGDVLSRRLFRGLVRGGAGPGGSTLGRTAGAGPPVALTAEQYQQHQEQLALMQKQQLEQIQQQANDTGSSQSLVSKTLDSVTIKKLKLYTRDAQTSLTAEQYQQHQEQLALMQKQQLEQIQQQANDTGSSQSLVSKTLDSVSAQFAASALVTSDQLLTLKVKEDGVGGGVNGVVQASGVYKGLSISATSSASVLTSQPTPTAAPPAFLSSTSNSNTSSTHTVHNPLGNHSNNTANSTSQVLISNNLRLSVTTPSIVSLNARHLPRSLSNVPPAALKLAAASNRQLPKVNTGENHEQEKQSLNSIAENTVAMEVT